MLLDCALHNPRALPYVVMTSALYLHLGPFSRQVIAEIDREIADIDNGLWHTPPLMSLVKSDLVAV